MLPDISPIRQPPDEIAATPYAEISAADALYDLRRCRALDAGCHAADTYFELSAADIYASYDGWPL